MGGYHLLTVEVTATVLTGKMMSIRGLEGGPMVVALHVVCKESFCDDIPATVVTLTSLPITPGFPPVPRQITVTTPSPSVLPWLVAAPGPPPNFISFVQPKVPMKGSQSANPFIFHAICIRFSGRMLWVVPWTSV